MRAGEVLVWCASLAVPDSVQTRLEALLPPGALWAKRAALGRFRAPGARRRLAAAGWLRALLGRCLGAPPEALVLRLGPHGKPYLCPERHPDAPAFNLSHAGDLALVAVSRAGRVGVDVEPIRPRRSLEALARRCLSAPEWADWTALPETQREAAFYAAWTRKEAFVKALGDGIAYGLRRFAVSLAPGEPPALRWVADEAEAPSRWTLAALEIAPGYAAAVAADWPDAVVRCWEATAALLPGELP